MRNRGKGGNNKWRRVGESWGLAQESKQNKRANKLGRAMADGKRRKNIQSTVKLCLSCGTVLGNFLGFVWAKAQQEVGLGVCFSEESVPVHKVTGEHRGE